MKKIYFLLSAFLLFGTLCAQTIYIPNIYFKSKLTVQSTAYGYAKDINGNSMIVDTNNDGEIQVSEAQNVYEFHTSGPGIDDLTGIEYFVNITKLSCVSCGLVNLNLSTLTHLQILRCNNNQLTTLNISGLSELSNIFASYNELTNLDLSSCTTLNTLWCDHNQLTTLNISALSNLYDFRCQNNNLTTLNASNLGYLNQLQCFNNALTNLDVSNSINLRILYFGNNQLSNVNVSQLINLSDIRFYNNPISSINLSGLNHITWIDLGGTQISSMNFSQMPLLQYIMCYACSLYSIDASENHNLGEIGAMNSPVLESVFMKNGKFNGIYASGPNLKYVCADQSEIENGNSLNLPVNTVVNSYCTFTPGGTFYTIQGNNKYDGNNDGCNTLDLTIPNLKYNITDGTNSGSLTSNTSGNYSIPVQAGTHTITPVLENPSYFVISSTNVNINFPAQTSPFTQNFCVTANGIHPDLEISLLPINAARPGFDATYKIIYKNKGNTTQSGTINLAFNDAVLDFVSSIPTTASQSVNNLSWNFTNLAPFETREITLTLNVNSPMENPAVNGGDILNYTTTITSSAIDNLPNDNTFVFNQTVVNSFDPNDKTCLQGATIAPEKVGDYVHYMIRFENTGTFPAENIVVKDMIDTAKFDVNSLIPVKGSHSFVTNITSGNKVEFIFENINLPFDDANNDGYVAFKIKTKPTLVNGNTFSNTASIYFDYNFPIVTNTATTTIAALSIQDFVFSNYFNIYPNPVSNVLSITQKENITINSINIYNTLGQLVLVIPNAKNTKTIYVSSLTTGNYFIKINADKGTSNTKFVKN